MLGLGRQSSDDKNRRQKLVRSGADSKAAAPKMSFWGDQGRQKRFLLPCYLLPLPGSYGVKLKRDTWTPGWANWPDQLISLPRPHPSFSPKS